MMAPVTKTQRDHQAQLRREAMRVLLSLPADPNDARLVLEYARELLGWVQHIRLVNE